MIVCCPSNVFIHHTGGWTFRLHCNYDYICLLFWIQEVDQLRMERLQIDEQLRQIGGGPRAPSGRPEKEKPFSSDNGMGHSRGGKPFGRGGRGRRGPTFASGTQTSSKISPLAWRFKNCSFWGSQNVWHCLIWAGGKGTGVFMPLLRNPA